MVLSRPLSHVTTLTGLNGSLQPDEISSSFEVSKQFCLPLSCVLFMTATTRPGKRHCRAGPCYSKGGVPPPPVAQCPTHSRWLINTAPSPNASPLIPERVPANTNERERVWQQEGAELQLSLLYCFDTSASDNGLLLGVSKRSLKAPAPASPACHKPQSAKAFPLETPCGFCLRKACGWSLLSSGSQIKQSESSRSWVALGWVGTHLSLQEWSLACVRERGHG